MKERYKRKQLPTWLGLLVVVGLFVLILVAHFLLTALASVLKITFMEYIEYALFILIGILIVRKWLTEYEYALVDNDLYVDRYIGKRPRRLFEISLSDISYIGRSLPEGFEGKKQRLTFASRRKGVVYIVYKAGESQRCVYFSPSTDLLALMEKRLSAPNG